MADSFRAERSFVRVQVVYDEPVPLDTYDGVDVTRMNREISPAEPFDLNVMARITVDGKPSTTRGAALPTSSACTDVALDQSRIQFHFDNSSPRLGLAVAAHPVRRGG